jgi:DNA-binding transcriptional MerR regulator
MRIGEVARLVGVSTDTVRFYERSGFLPRPSRADNRYREYGERDVEHLRLLIDLRRLDLPLDDAARIARWCHAGHCADMTSALPQRLAERRRSIADRIAGLQRLDAHLAALERHLARQSGRTLDVLGSAGACCDAAEAVMGLPNGGCACCADEMPAISPG